jgi:hypothetical protein
VPRCEQRKAKLSKDLVRSVSLLFQVTKTLNISFSLSGINDMCFRYKKARGQLTFGNWNRFDTSQTSQMIYGSLLRFYNFVAAKDFQGRLS